MGKKINFGKDNIEDTKLVKGSYEQMLKAREEKMPEMQEAIQALFDNWEGQPLAVIMVNEDENGNPTGAHELIVGAGKPNSQIRLVKGLTKAGEDIVKVLGKHTATLDEDDMFEMITQVIEAISKKTGRK